jgi:hypothetical protein
MKHTPSGIALSLLLTLMAALPTPVQAQAGTKDKVKGQALLTAKPALPRLPIRLYSAKGQLPYTCEFDAGAGKNECLPFEVGVWLIPTVKPTDPKAPPPPPAGCVSALPYASLKLPAKAPPVAKKVTLTWNLPQPPAGFEFRFAANGIEVKALDKDLFGVPGNLLDQPDPQPTTFVWSINAAVYTRFIGNHQANVQYRPSPKSTKTEDQTDWLDCVPVDPVITNSD